MTTAQVEKRVNKNTSNHKARPRSNKPKLPFSEAEMQQLAGFMNEVRLAELKLSRTMSLVSYSKRDFVRHLTRRQYKYWALENAGNKKGAGTMLHMDNICRDMKVGDVASYQSFDEKDKKLSGNIIVTKKAEDVYIVENKLSAEWVDECLTKGYYPRSVRGDTLLYAVNILGKQITPEAWDDMFNTVRYHAKQMIPVFDSQFGEWINTEYETDDSLCEKGFVKPIGEVINYINTMMEIRNKVKAK